MPLSPALKSWQTAFEAQSPDDRQRTAFAGFLALGLPTVKDDAWKYTDLRRLSMREYRTAPPFEIQPTDADKLLLAMPSHRLIFVDGKFVPALSSPLPAEISLTDESALSPRSGAFELLNAGLTRSAMHLRVRSNSKVELPIYIAHVWTRSAQALMWHPRIIISLESGANAMLIEHHISRSSEANLTNAVIDLEIGDSATLGHVRLQDDARGNFNIGSIRAQVARGGSYLNHHYAFGAGLARTDIQVALKGEEARAELHGLIFANQTQHLDVRTCIEHQAPNTQSREDYRGIADHRGRVVFNGKVIVAKDAQRIDAAQSSRNLLLSPHAEIDTRPELEIYANDVKCAHGATVGQLDANSLFYLRSRGVSLENARSLLTQAFAVEVVDRAPLAPVRDYVLDGLQARMKTEVASL